MSFHIPASVSPQEGEEHRAAPMTSDALVHSEGEALEQWNFFLWTRDLWHNHQRLQAPRRWHSWSSDQGPAPCEGANK